MKTFKIEASKRVGVGKKDSKDLRKNELVPCVLYGGKENLHFTLQELAFRNLVYSPDVFIVELNIDGKKVNAVMQDIQFHPVSDKVIHIDFKEVFEDKPVIVNIPVETHGNSVGIKAGGKLRLRKRKLKVKGLYKNIPDALQIDISDLNIGDSYMVGDLKYDGLQLLDPARAMVVGVISSRLAALESGEGEPAAAPAEGAAPAATPAAEAKPQE
jgi:large subunit ribosomal protein L25